MLKFFLSSTSADNHLANEETFELLRSNNPNYGSITKKEIKEIKSFSLCPPASTSFQNKLMSLNNEQVEEVSDPRIIAGMSK